MEIAQNKVELLSRARDLNGGHARLRIAACSASARGTACRLGAVLADELAPRGGVRIAYDTIATD
eukprot:1265336-Pleurochrysis_carterae.AAC.1